MGLGLLIDFSGTKLGAPKACVKFWTPIDTLAASGIKFLWRSVVLAKEERMAHGV
jgi:hypothetical protein